MSEHPDISSRSKMVQDNAHIRQRGSQDFMAYYDFACARQESVPLPAVTMNLDKGMLDFNGDRVKLTDWPPILNSISINKHLHHIAISSRHQSSLGSGNTDPRYYKSILRRKIPAIRTKDITFKLCKAIGQCLSVSPNLKTLQLNGLPLRESDLITLTKGVAKSVCLENLSLANCPISDEGLEVICQSVKYSTKIRMVDFTGCNLTWRGAEHMANIIKHQAMQRHGTAWAESLRYRQPQFEGMGGLRRVTLNCNPLIGDRGAAALAHELMEDLWVKAVDLQRCGLSSEGARRLLAALKTNCSLFVLDIRSNPLVDKVLTKTIIEKVLMNANGHPSEYCWIKPAATEPRRVSRPTRQVLPSPARGKVTFRKAASRKGSSPRGSSSGVTKPKKPYTQSSYVPWRAAARAGRQRGMPPGVRVNDQSFQDATTVKITLESEGEEDEEEEKVVVEVEQGPSSHIVQDRITEQHIKHMQMALKECRLKLTEERRARLIAESRLMEYELENARLRNTNFSLSEALAATGSASAPPATSALEDEAVLQSIESSFTKFHAFLDLLRDAGLGQLASMAGIDQSDFQPRGRPQLSSTIGPPLHSAASLARTEYRNVGTKTDTSSLFHSVLPARPGKPVDTNPPRMLSSVKESSHEDLLLGVNSNQVSGPAIDLGVGDGVGEFPRAVTQNDSEHSSHSQTYFNNAYFGKTFQTRPSHPKSNSSSHRSNGSGSSGRSNIIDRAESIGSVMPRNKMKGKRVTEGQSESEGSDYRVRENLGSLRGQSDDESF